MTRLLMAAAASLLALVLTGCGDKDSKPAEPAATTTEAAAPADANAEQKPAEEQSH